MTSVSAGYIILKEKRFWNDQESSLQRKQSEYYNKSPPSTSKLFIVLLDVFWMIHFGSRNYKNQWFLQDVWGNTINWRRLLEKWRHACIFHHVRGHFNHQQISVGDPSLRVLTSFMGNTGIPCENKKGRKKEKKKMKGLVMCVCAVLFDYSVNLPAEKGWKQLSSSVHQILRIASHLHTCSLCVCVCSLQILKGILQGRLASLSFIPATLINRQPHPCKRRLHWLRWLRLQNIYETNHLPLSLSQFLPLCFSLFSSFTILFLWTYSVFHHK